MKKYFITEEQMNGLINFLGEIPAKFANPLLNDIGFFKQNQEIKEEKKDVQE